MHEEDANALKKFADLAAGPPLASSSTHQRRRNAKKQFYQELWMCIVNGEGFHCDKLLAIAATVEKSDAT